MTKTFKFNNETLPFQADLETLKNKLLEVRQLIINYQEVESDLDSVEYMARGNGFCDTKYREDFLDRRIADLSQKAIQLEQWIRDFESL